MTAARVQECQTSDFDTQNNYVSECNDDGGFLQIHQLEMVKPFVKQCYALKHPIDLCIKYAVNECLKSGPGPCYIDINTKPSNKKHYSSVCNQNESLHQSNDITGVISALQASHRPLLVIGKGCSLSRTEDSIIHLVNRLGIPFIAMPMAKGVVDDNHKLCVTAARTFALENADLIIVLAARLNWQLRIKKSTQIIRIDRDANELRINQRNPESFNICAHVGNFCEKILAETKSFQGKNPCWIQHLNEVRFKNIEYLANETLKECNEGMSHLQALHTIKEYITPDCIIVNDGANTMDLGRRVFSYSQPRKRLDAGTLGTMGIGVPFAIAASLHNRSTHVFCITGDSAFGFSAMDLDTAARYNLPIIFVVFNNGYIYRRRPNRNRDVLQLDQTSKYEKIAEAFNCQGAHVTTQKQLKDKIKEFMSINKPTLINVRIDPDSGKCFMKEH